MSSTLLLETIRMLANLLITRQHRETFVSIRSFIYDTTKKPKHQLHNLILHIDKFIHLKSVEPVASLVHFFACVYQDSHFVLFELGFEWRIRVLTLIILLCVSIIGGP